MQSAKRRHTLVAGKLGGAQICAALYKDWFLYSWCENCETHQRIIIGNHEFHVVSLRENLSIEQAQSLASAALAGKVFTLDLREYSTVKYGLENGG